MRSVTKVIFILCALIGCLACNKKTTQIPAQRDLLAIVANDTLHVGTIFGPTTYFYYRDVPMGYDYDLAKSFAASIHTHLKVHTYSSVEELYDQLETGDIDLIAFPCVPTRERKKTFTYFSTHKNAPLHLVQIGGKEAIKNAAQLQEKRIYIPRNSQAYTRLKHLNMEIGGNMRIILAHDSVSIDMLIADVVNGKLPYTAAYAPLAQLYQQYYPQLDISVALGVEQTLGWVTRNSSTALNETISLWLEKMDETEIEKLYTRYLRKNNTFKPHPYFETSSTSSISPYDQWFKEYAPQINWDWRLLAAVAFHESRFNPNTVSPMGACGLMQLMPVTGAKFGLDSLNMFDPEANIAAGVQYIKYLKMVYHDIENKEEKTKFVLASYNAGPAHVLDAMKLTEKYGGDPHIWYGNVEYYLQKKNDPEFYNDPVVRYGYFNSGPTRSYVQNVLATYHNYISRKQ